MTHDQRKEAWLGAPDILRREVRTSHAFNFSMERRFLEAGDIDAARRYRAMRLQLEILFGIENIKSHE